MRALDLFSGLGGFALGMEAAGHETAAFCEANEFCRRLLARRWPGVPIYDDVRTLTARRLAADGIVFNGICGGFPCQDLSLAGRGAGLEGERSGLWFEYLRIIDETRPDWVVIENVRALLNRGLDVILSGLASIRYDAEWDVFGADDIGASQHRKRLWVLAYPDDAGLQGPIWVGQSHAPREERQAAHCEPLRSACGFWPPGPRAVSDIPRMADGPADRTHRLRALGNSVVPAIPEMIGRAIMAAEHA